MYHGDIRLGDTIDIKFTTRQISGAPSTLGGTPAVSAYPGNSTTQLTAGITLSVDFDTVTGLNNVRVVATSGNGYVTATNYTLVITTGTVNSVSVVGECIGSFSIENRSAVMPTTAGRTLTADASGNVTLADAVAHGGTLGSSTATFALSRFNVTSQTANTAAVTYAGNGTNPGISISGGATGPGASINGGGTSGIGIAVGTTSGHGVAITAVGASKHGLLVTGGDSGTSDGIKAVAGTGGVDIRGNITGNLVGTVSTLTTYTGNTPQTADVATLITTVGAAGAGLTSVGLATTSRAGIRKNTALAAFEFLMTDSTNHNPATGKTVTVTRSIDGAAFGAGTLSAVTEVAVGIYAVDFGAGDLNGNVITLRATAASCDDTFVTIKTSP